MRTFIWIVGIFLIWEFFVITVGGIAPNIIHEFGGRFPYIYILKENNFPSWFWVWGNFDGVHYIRLAKFGYGYSEYSQAFFPFYPTLMRLINDLIFNNYFLAGFFISTISFVVALYFLYKLILIDYSRKIAKWTLFFLLAFPTSFFFTAIYTESLFLLLIVASFLAARKKYWILAGILGLFASLTRFVGIFLFPALLLEYYLQNNERVTLPYVRRSLKSTGFLLFIPAGIILYMFYLDINYGDPFYFITAQPAFGASRTGGGQLIFLPQVIWRYFKIFTSIPFSSLSFFTYILEFFISILFLTLGFFALFKVRLSWAVFSFLSLIIPTFTGTFSSMPRYVLVAFPVFIFFAQLKTTFYKYLILVIFSLLLIVSVFLFTRGYWIA